MYFYNNIFLRVQIDYINLSALIYLVKESYAFSSAHFINLDKLHYKIEVC